MVRKDKLLWLTPFGFPHKSGFPSLRMQDSLEKVDSYVLIRHRFTIECHSGTIKTIGLPDLF